MTGLGACSITLAALVPRAPTVRLRPARATLAHACSRLEQVPSALQAPVLRATSPAGVEPGALRYAAASAGEGVRGIVDGLTTVRRLVGSRR